MSLLSRIVHLVMVIYGRWKINTVLCLCCVCIYAETQSDPSLSQHCSWYSCAINYTLSDWNRVSSYCLTSDSLCWTSSHKDSWCTSYLPTFRCGSANGAQSFCYLHLQCGISYAWAIVTATVCGIMSQKKKKNYSAVWALRNSTLATIG